MKTRLSLLFFLLCGIGVAAMPQSTPREIAERIFRRLTGVPLLLTDPRLKQMEDLIQKGQLVPAARIATQDERFYRLTVRHMAGLMSTKEETPYAPFNDFTAMFVGVTRDDLDARTLLSGDFTYQLKSPDNLPAPDPGSNDHYQQAEDRRVNLKDNLTRIEPQRAGLKEAAGALTSRAWAAAHLSGGTNRRAIQYSYQEFLCSPITQWKEAGLDDRHVRRDVDRTPGGNPATYQQVCRSCHAPMDSIGGAYAHFDFDTNAQQPVWFGKRVAPKMNRNGHMFPAGYVTLDDSWASMDTPVQKQLFGFRGPTSGHGLTEFGKMLANSQRFKTCMTERVFREVCQRAATSDDQPAIHRIADDFETSGYRLKKLFEEVAAEPTCSGAAGGGSPVTVAPLYFRRVLETLAVTTGVDPSDTDIQSFYQQALTRLPRSGTPAEVTQPGADCRFLAGESLL